jgi:hypothetical protein
LEVHVENVNLPPRASLSVLIEGANIASLTLNNSGGAEFEFQSNDGAVLPPIADGTRLVITDAAGNTILAGAFSTEPWTPPPPPSDSRIEAELAGAAKNGLTPSGEADFRSYADGRRQLDVEVEKLNLPGGTHLNILIDGNPIGEIILNSKMEGEFFANSGLPAVNKGSRIVITDHQGMMIVGGTFNAHTEMPEHANEIDDSRFFVKKQYEDFLNRQPDVSGLDFWNNQFASCANDANCIDSKRIVVSAAFFLSTEFQQTGYMVYRLENVSFNRVPSRVKFLMDAQAFGQGGDLNQRARAFATVLINRPEFKQLYDARSNAQYVDALIANTHIPPDSAERIALISGLAAGTETRASVLLRVSQNDSLYRQEFNRAFVLMQYFGYLHRDPEQAGFDFWVRILDQMGGETGHSNMVEAFIKSLEYRDRFNH